MNFKKQLINYYMAIACLIIFGMDYPVAHFVNVANLSSLAALFDAAIF